MECYAAVRRSVYVEGLSERAAARRVGLARETVRKMLRSRLPPGYRRAKPIRCPKLDAFTGVIDQILTDDQPRPKQHRHTATRIWARFCVEHAFTGGYTIVKDSVRRQPLGGHAMFVPLAHPPGDAQADFGDALVVIDGVECQAHDVVVDLPHSATTRARSVRPRRRQLPQGPSVCDKIAASSDCSRPVNDYVHIEAADLCRPNARFTKERQGYQVLTPFGKLGYSQYNPRCEN